MKFIISTLILFIFINSIYAQNNVVLDSPSKSRKNAIYLEVGGKGLIYTLNYERVFSEGKNLQLSAKIGASLVPVGYAYNDKLFSVPYGINFLVGSGKHKFEIGLGQTFMYQYTSYYFATQGSGNYLRIYSFKTKEAALSTFPTGATYYDGDWSSYLVNTITLGYRRMPKNGGLFFSTSAMIMFAPIKLGSGTQYDLVSNFVFANKIVLYIGIGIGYCF